MNKDSVLFEKHIKKNKIDDAIKRLDINNYIVQLSDLSQVLDLFKRKFKYALTQKVVEAVTIGDIALANIPEDVKIPSFFPTWLNKDSSGRIRAIVNVSPYRDLQFKDGIFTGNTAVLFSLLQGGYIIRGATLNEKVVTGNITIVLAAMNVYSALFIKVLDKLHSVSLNLKEYNVVIADVNRFFLVHLLGREAIESTNKLALSSIPEAYRSAVSDDIKKFESMDITSFIEFLSSDVPTLKKLDFRNFISTWMSLYSSMTVLGLELFPYFLSTIVGQAMVNSPLVKSYFIERTGGSRDLINVYNELSKKI